VTAFANMVPVWFLPSSSFS